MIIIMMIIMIIMIMIMIISFHFQVLFAIAACDDTDVCGADMLLPLPWLQPWSGMCTY